MGFFSDLFKKKTNKLTPEQIDTIDERVELTQKKFSGERKIWSDLLKPRQVKLKPTVQIPIKKIIKKSKPKKVKKNKAKKTKKKGKK